MSIMAARCPPAGFCATRTYSLTCAATP
jgi:hypothetical protein